MNDRHNPKTYSAMSSQRHLAFLLRATLFCSILGYAENISQIPNFQARLKGGASRRLGPEDINSEHLTKSIIQALEEMGYLESARCLELESGISLVTDSDTEECLRLKYALVDGQWQDVAAILNHSAWAPQHMRYPIFRQKYLELLAAGRSIAAENCLQHDLEPSISTKGQRRDYMKLGRLLLMQPGPEELRAIGYIGSGLAGRVKAADAALQCAPTKVKFPASRLRRLLAQVI
jgi:hypothetical protein